MSDKSSWAKDFGMYVSGNTPKDAEPPVMLIKKFIFWKLAILEPNLFSVTSNTQVAGEDYAMTVDFDHQIFNKIMAVIPEEQSKRIRRWVESIRYYPQILPLTEEPISVEMRVRLGSLTHGDGEDFIPFIAIDATKPE